MCAVFVVQGLGPHVPSELSSLLQPGGASFAIWTTTPWTIPANLAVAVNGHLDYALVEAQVGLGDGPRGRLRVGCFVGEVRELKLVVHERPCMLHTLDNTC